MEPTLFNILILVPTAKDSKMTVKFVHIGSAISIETPPVGFFLKFSNV
jgi:hypothetical protein